MAIVVVVVVLHDGGIIPLTEGRPERRLNDNNRDNHTGTHNCS